MKTRNETQKASQTRGVVRAWKPLFTQLQTTVEWALDLAVRLAAGDDDDVEAIERVRAYLRAWIAGRCIDLDLNDLLTTLGILFAAIELDRSITNFGWRDSAFAVEHTCVHCPGAVEVDDETIYRAFTRAQSALATDAAASVRRRHRNAASPTHLAA